MTYNVFGGTLNLAQSINHSISLNFKVFLLVVVNLQSIAWKTRLQSAE